VKGTACTYHLTPRAYWEAQPPDADYTPEAFAADGFIHCTTGAHNLIDTANCYYRDDPRDFVAVLIDLSKVRAEVRIEGATAQAAGIYPHIHGALNRDAVVDVQSLIRTGSGEFVSISD
jgi:uncharacterized protein (DUF952 family)